MTLEAEKYPPLKTFSKAKKNAGKKSSQKQTSDGVPLYCLLKNTN